MYQVLIADDEAIVRMMLSSMIDWESMDMELACCAANGREALAYMEQNPVDILITDIQMPVMDGLDLIRQVNERKNPPEILVLSAYNDFPYVRQAFRMGVFDYCLKRELNEEMLTRYLLLMKEKIKKKEENVQTEEKEAEHIAQVSFLSKDDKKIRAVLLRQLLHGELEPQQARLPERYFVVYISIIGYQRLIKNFGSDFERDFFGSFTGLAEQISQISARGLLAEANVTDYVLLYNALREEEETCLDSLLRTCRRLLKAWKNYMNVDAIAAVSSLAKGSQEFEAHLSEAALTLSMQYMKKSCKLFSPRDCRDFSIADACSHEEDYQEIIQALKQNEEVAFEAAKSRFLEKLQKKNVEDTRKDASYLAYHIAASLVHQLEDGNYVYKNDLLDTLQNLATTNEVCIWTVNFLNDMRHYMQLHYQFNFPDEIGRAVSYINDQYFRADLTLYEVASKAGFSEKYFSTLFGKRMGISFSGYLKRLRIHHAKKMLKETDRKMREISEAVGYNSVEYFVRVFAAEEGIKPSEYRRQCRTIVQ